MTTTKYTIGETFSGDTRLVFPWNGKEVCAGVGKVDEGKWLPLALEVNRAPQMGHFRSIRKATILDTGTNRTAKQAAKVAVKLISTNVPGDERPEFPHGEFDNGGHWRGEQ